MYTKLASCFVALAFCFPLNPSALLVGFGGRVAFILASLPYVHDSQNVRVSHASSHSYSTQVYIDRYMYVCVCVCVCVCV